jgi:hypothetical protein
MNIFTTENIAKYNTKPRYAGVGEYVLRNGVWAMDIRPEPFYQNYGTGDSRLLSEEFQPNTQYIVDLWIDADDCKSSGNYVACGLTLVYTDNTTKADAVVTGADGKGFQHVQYVTDPAKSVQKFTVYYYTSTPVYYRADSFVSPLSNTTSVGKNGIITSGEFNEQITTPSDFSVKFGKGYIEANEFIEI